VIQAALRRSDENRTSTTVERAVASARPQRAEPRGAGSRRRQAATFVGPKFTPRELRSVYEGGWGTDLEAANFWRKVLANDLATATGRTASPGPEGGKSAELSLARLPATALLFSPLLAPDPDKWKGRPKRQGKGDRR